MEKLLAQAQELVASLQEAKSEVRRNADELASKVTATSKLQKELDNLKGELEAREALLVSAEKPGVLLAEAKKIQAENKESLIAIDTAQRSFGKERAEFNSKVSKDKAELQADKDLVAKELEVLKSDRKQLEAAKKSYKDDILAKLKVAV